MMQLSDREILARRGIGNGPFIINELSGRYIVDFNKKVVYEMKGETPKYIVKGLYENLIKGDWSIRGERRKP